MQAGIRFSALVTFAQSTAFMLDELVCPGDMIGVLKRLRVRIDPLPHSDAMRGPMEQTVENIDRPLSKSGIDAQESDDMLAAMASLGDEDAFERLFIRHSRRIARLIGRFFGAAETVEDVAQEVFTKMFFALPGYKPDPDASFAAWLSRITVNACYDRLRRDRRRPEDSIASISEYEAARLHARLNHSAGGADAEAKIISRDLAEKLLANLGPEDRIVLALLEIDDMPVAEIAMLTGWSKSKVKVRAHRARASLRRILSRYL